MNLVPLNPATLGRRTSGAPGFDGGGRAAGAGSAALADLRFSGRLGCGSCARASVRPPAETHSIARVRQCKACGTSSSGGFFSRISAEM